MMPLIVVSDRVLELLQTWMRRSGITSYSEAIYFLAAEQLFPTKTIEIDYDKLARKELVKLEEVRKHGGDD